MKRGRAAVVVLGDLGRSPRMQYHALSLATQADLEVDVVAYEGTDPHRALLENSSIHIHRMKQPMPRSLPKIIYMLMLPFKALIQFVVLLWMVCIKIPAPDVFIVQNPPSVPALIVVKCASWLRHSSFVIDWHNFGYTLLGLTIGRSHPLVRMYKWCEMHFGRMASGSFCVTKAMQHELDQNWGIRAKVVYDQPPEFFRPATLEEKHGLFCRLHKEISYHPEIQDFVTVGNTDVAAGAITDDCYNSATACKTLFTLQNENGIDLDNSRPALIVSSTSWTPDEDFSILLEAAVMYDRRVAAILNELDSVENETLWRDMSSGKQYLYPRLLFIITGKGPERKMYEEKIQKLRLKRVSFRTMWLSAEDYPLLLGAADLGVCLHTSSSGLDLPMKVVDMFGCGLPVCAVSYSCITELVNVDKNGLLFTSSSELADQLLMLFKGFPNDCSSLLSLRNGALETASSAKWATEWEQHAMPLINKVITEGKC